MTEPRTNANPPTTIYAEPTNEELAAQAARVPAPAGAAAAPAPRERRHVGRKIGRGFAIAGAIALAAGVGGYVASPAHSSNDAWEVAAGQVDRVDIDLPMGDIKIVQSDDGRVRFSEDLQYRGAEIKTDHRLSGKTLEIDTGRPAFRISFGLQDRLKYTLALPKGVAIDFKQSAGDSEISGRYGEVKVEMSAGDLNVTELEASSVDLRISSGEASLTRVIAPTLKLEQSAGNTTVKFAAAPTNLDVRVSAGNVDAYLPGSESYRVSERKSAGNIHIGVPRGNDEQHKVNVDVSAGNVQLKQA